MARELSTPLTAEDLAWLQARLPHAHVENIISHRGVEDGVTPETSEDAESGSEDSSGTGGTEDTGSAGSGSEGNEEDLIGPTFDPTEHTEAEIKEYLEANPADHDRVIAAEAEGRQRKGVLAL